MSSNKHLPWKFNSGFARSSSPWNCRQWEKIYVKTWTTTGEKEQNEGQQAISFGCFAPHTRHLFVTNYIRSHLEARNNQSAMRNQPTLYAFSIQSLYYPCGYQSTRTVSNDHRSIALFKAFILMYNRWRMKNQSSSITATNFGLLLLLLLSFFAPDVVRLRQMTLWRILNEVFTLNVSS